MELRGLFIIQGVRTRNKKPEKELVEKGGFEALANYEANQNLIGFFALLLEEDKRQNPQNYKSNKN